RRGLEQVRVAGIAMYQDEVTQVRRELRMVALPGLALDTVDAFEGEEADVVILSLVRSNEAERIGFLKKAQRLNVAISRAKQLLVVVGDIETMTGREGQDLYRPLLEHVEREGRVAGIGALHAMDAAVGGRRRGDQRRPRPAGGPGGRPRRRASPRPPRKPPSAATERHIRPFARTDRGPAATGQTRPRRLAASGGRPLPAVRCGHAAAIPPGSRRAVFKPPSVAAYAAGAP